MHALYPIFRLKEKSAATAREVAGTIYEGQPIDSLLRVNVWGRESIDPRNSIDSSQRLICMFRVELAVGRNMSRIKA